MMARPGCLLSALLIGLATVHAVPVQLQGGLNVLRHDEYAPASSDYVPRYLESYGSSKESGKRNLDQIGGGHLLRSLNEILAQGVEQDKHIRAFDNILDGQLMRGLNPASVYQGFSNGKRNLDQIGGGNLVRSLYTDSKKPKEKNNNYDESSHLDSIGGGILIKNMDPYNSGNRLRNLDSIGGGNLVRTLDHIGGGNLVRSSNEPLQNQDLLNFFESS